MEKSQFFARARGYLDGPMHGVRVLDTTTAWAGPMVSCILADFGCEVIHIDPPDLEEQYPLNLGDTGLGYMGQTVNRNKLGITLDLRTEEGKELLADLVRISDAVTENFAAGVLDRLGFGYDRLRELREDIVYVSNSGFGATGPYASFKSWGPIAQAVSGLTFQSGLPDLPPAGWGYSFMDHTGGYYMAIATLMALFHRRRTGEGQWVDLACIEAAGTLHGAVSLDASVNGRPARREGMPNSNRSRSPAMAPHGIYPAAGEDEWVAIAVRSDDEWQRLAAAIGEPWCDDPSWDRLVGRLAEEDRLDASMAAWTVHLDKAEVAALVTDLGIAAAPALRPGERIDDDPRTGGFGLWVDVEHAEVGTSRVEGLPVHLSETDWSLHRGAPCLGEHNRYVICDLLGRTDSQLEALVERGVV